MTKTIENTAIVLPASLSDAQLADLLAAQQNEEAVFKKGSEYQRTRAVAYFNRHKFVSGVTPEALAYHVQKVMDFKVDGLRLEGAEREYQKCAMAILKLDVLRETEKSVKADYNNRISDLRRALEALNHFSTEIADMSDEAFTAWFAKKGGLDGISREFRQANPKETEPTRDAKKISAAIDGMIENTTAIEVANPGGETGVRLFVARGEGDKLRLVPLDASADFIASLSNRAPDAMTNAPPRLVMFRELLMTAARIVPDQISDQPKRMLRPGEKVSASTEMLAANQIIRVEKGGFSIAGSRVEDTIIVEVTPADENLARRLSAEGFIDTMTRKNMLAKLEPTAIASGFKEVTIVDADTKSGSEVRISFGHTTKSVDGQLLVKSMDRIGGVYTWRVKAFEAKAGGDMDATARKQFKSRFLALVVKSRDDHAISVTVSAKGIGFKLGSTKAEMFASTGLVGSEDVRVNKDDFLLALNGLLALPLEGDMGWSIDPRGLLRIEARTASASYRVFVQLLRKEKDPKAQVRERALLERVERTVEVAAAA